MPQMLHLKLELSNLRLRGFNSCELNGNLFIKCYIPAGNCRRISIETSELIISSSTNPNPTWDHIIASLECHGSSTHIKELLESHIVFELHIRKNSSRVKNELIGKGELAWSEIYGAKDLALVMVNKEFGLSMSDESLELLVNIALEITKVNEEVKKKGGKRMEWSEVYGCEWSAFGEDMSAITTAFVDDAF